MSYQSLGEVWLRKFVFRIGSAPHPVLLMVQRRALLISVGDSESSRLQSVKTRSAFGPTIVAISQISLALR